MSGKSETSRSEGNPALTGASGKADRLRVVIADADPLARRVVRDSLQTNVDLIVVAEATDGVEAVELGLHYRPELMLIEYALPRLDGVEVTRRIKSTAPGINVVIFAVERDGDVQMRALRAGASGFISKDTEIGAVAQILRAVARGEAAISRKLTMSVIERLRLVPDAQGMRPVKSPLTNREWEVLDLISSGCSTRDIADNLCLTDATVYSHSKRILKKLGVHTRREAVVVGERLRQGGTLS
jgi:two-component system, NarL family, response regulator LiaR